MSRKSWRRNGGSSPSTPAGYFRSWSKALLEEKMRLEELLKAQPDFEGMTTAAIAAERLVTAICDDKRFQRRRLPFFEICLKPEAGGRIYDIVAEARAWELRLFQKWPKAYPAKGRDRVLGSYWIASGKQTEMPKKGFSWVGIDYYRNWMIEKLKELHYDVKADIEVCKKSIAEYTRHAETAKAEMIAFKGTPEQLEKARISALLNRARSGAQEIRLVLPRNHPCPYCGESLGNSPHADHIHPVAKGGLSTKQNMVYICKECNIKKSHTTLTAFAAKEGRDLAEILARLRALGKEF
jgi:HNH endonuclease